MAGKTKRLAKAAVTLAATALVEKAIEKAVKDRRVRRKVAELGKAAGKQARTTGKAAGRKVGTRRAAAHNQAFEQVRIARGREEERQRSDIRADRVHAAYPEMLRNLKDESAHALGRHHVRSAFGSSKSRQVEQEHRIERLDLRKDPAEGINALRPWAGEKDGNPIRLPAARIAYLQAVNPIDRHVSDVWKAIAHGFLLALPDRRRDVSDRRPQAGGD